MQLILDTKGISVKKRNNCFHIATAATERLISPARVSSIAITAYCTLSSSAITMAIQHGIPIYFLNQFGKVEGRLWTGEFGNLSTNRRLQVWFLEHPAATRWVTDLYVRKIEAQIGVLQTFAGKRKQAKASNIIAADVLQNSIAQLQALEKQPLKAVRQRILGLEGTAARTYWKALSANLPSAFQFAERSQHPAQDTFNCLLNYAYGMLYGLVETAIFAAGLDPYLGVFHVDQFDKPTLSYDLIEPFRPWVDLWLAEGLQTWPMKETFFDHQANAVVLTKTGKAFLIPQFNDFWAERVLFKNKNIKRKAHIARATYDFIDHLKQTFGEQKNDAIFGLL